jgi:hypothetical protein
MVGRSGGRLAAQNEGIGMQCLESAWKAPERREREHRARAGGFVDSFWRNVERRTSVHQSASPDI